MAQVRRAEGVAAEVAIGLGVGGQRERSLVEIVVQAGRAARSGRIADQVGPERCGAAEIADAARIVDRRAGVEQHVDGLAGVRSIDARQFPSAEDRIQRAGQRRAVLAAFSERKLVDDAGHVDQFHIVAGGSPLRLQVANVLRIGDRDAGGHFQLLFGIAQGFRPGERIQQIESG